MAEVTRILITGATGMIGSALVRLVLRRTDWHVYAAGRNAERAARVLPKDSRLHFLRYDVTTPLKGDTTYDYIVHAASGATPAAFASDPVGVMTANIIGTRGLLEYGRQHAMRRFLYVSSGEVYGQTQLDLVSETDSGYVDPMQPRSCYPTAKRAAETLCAAYAKQYGMHIVVARPCHIYGAGFTESDNRAFADFLTRAAHGQDIVMHSAGEAFRSWVYVDDCAEALLTILTRGDSGEAYNIASNESNVTIRQFAETIAQAAGVSVAFDIPADGGNTTPIRRAVFNTEKLQALGWQPRHTLAEGIAKALKQLADSK